MACRYNETALPTVKVSQPMTFYQAERLWCWRRILALDSMTNEELAAASAYDWSRRHAPPESSLPDRREAETETPRQYPPSGMDAVIFRCTKAGWCRVVKLFEAGVPRKKGNHRTRTTLRVQPGKVQLCCKDADIGFQADVEYPGTITMPLWCLRRLIKLASTLDEEHVELRAEQGKMWLNTATEIPWAEVSVLLLSADQLEAAAGIGRLYTELGVKTLAEWSSAMLAEGGEAVRPHLQAIWDQIHGAMAPAEPQEPRPAEAAMLPPAVGEPSRAPRNLARPLQLRLLAFDTKAAELLDDLGVESTDIEAWMRAGILSYDPRRRAKLNEAEEAELTFVVAIARSGLSYEALCRALAQLEKPYAYWPSDVLWDFGQGKWRDVPGEIGAAVEDAVEKGIEEALANLTDEEIQDRLDRLVEEGDLEGLRTLLASVQEAIRQVSEGGGGVADGEAL